MRSGLGQGHNSVTCAGYEHTRPRPLAGICRSVGYHSDFGTVLRLQHVTCGFPLALDALHLPLPLLWVKAATPSRWSGCRASSTKPNVSYCQKSTGEYSQNVPPVCTLGNIPYLMLLVRCTPSLLFPHFSTTASILKAVGSEL